MAQAQGSAPSYTWSKMTQNLVLANTVTSHPSANQQGGWNGRTKWLYVETANGEKVIDPVMAFYRDPPPDAKCIWSTDHGRQAPAFFDKNALTLPQRDLAIWRDDKLSSVGHQYQMKYWEDLKFLIRPETFEDLYKYFDSATLWQNGAYNMWNLINMLATTAHHRWPQVLAEWRIRIDTWVNDYVHVRPGYQHNQDILREWNGLQDPLELANGFLDWNYEEVNEVLDLQQQDMLREALISQYRLITGVQYNPPQFYPNFPRTGRCSINPFENNKTFENGTQPVTATQPVVVTSASTNPAPAQLPSESSPSKLDTNVSTTTAGHNESVTPRKSSTSASLKSIPEEPNLVNNDTMTNDVADKSIDDSTAETEANDMLTEAPTTGSEVTTKAPNPVPQTIVEEIPIPEIVTKVATPPRGATIIIPDRKDSDGETDDILFNPKPQPSSGYLQAQSQERSLSVSSAPDQESKSVLSGADTTAGQRKRVASDAPEHKPSRKSTHIPGPGVPHANKNGKQGVGRGNGRKGVPTQGPMKHGPFGNGPKYRPEQQMQQQGPPSVKFSPHDAHLSQQMQPPSGPSNGIAQTSTQFIPSPSGTISEANRFVPGPPPPPGMGLAPMMGPPMMPFQDQVPIPPLHMGQPQFDPQIGQPINLPLHFMGPQHQAPPMYQDNGYVQQRTYHNNGNSDRFNYMQGPDNDGRRRSSVASNISRSKVRDDPIHGAVYALGQPRKGSSSSMGRRPSFANTAHNGNAGPKLACKNYRANDFTRTQFDQTFHECPCRRCEEASRSVYVKVRAYPRADFHYDVEGIIKRHFASKYGPIAVTSKSENCFLIVLPTDLDAIKAVQEVCNSRTSPIIPGLNTSVYYPLYSKHYTNSYDNPKGFPRHVIEARNQAFPADMQNRRDSNPFRVQHPTETFNGPNSGNGDHGPAQNGFGPVAQPDFPSNGPPGLMPSHNNMAGNGITLQPLPQPPLRQLWDPSAAPSRQSTAPASFAKVEQGTVSTNDSQVMAQRREQILKAEDWRSKPPSEEVVPADGENVAIATETASNHSFQGGKSIKVSLPSEEGSAREAVSQASSRSASPEIDNKPQESSEEQPSGNAVAFEPEVAKDERENSTASSRTMAPDIVKPIETHRKKSSKGVQQTQPKKMTHPPKKPKSVSEKASGYRKTATDLTSAVEDLGIESSGYSKTGTEVPPLVESLGNLGTVIRHKPRSHLPTDWATGEAKSESAPKEEPTTSSSDIRARFGEIKLELAHETTIASSDQALEALADTLISIQYDKLKQQAQDIDQSQQPTKKRKSKNKQAQGSPLPASQSGTSTDMQSRGPSLAFNTRPASSAATTNASTSRGPSPAMQNSDNRLADGTSTSKRNKNKKLKGKPTQPASELSESLAKDNNDQDVRPGSSLKKAKTSNIDQSEKKTELEALKATGNAQAKIDEQPNDSNHGQYRVHNGGSLRMNKNRSQKNRLQDRKENRSPGKGDITPSLSTIFEPPATEAKDLSPEANPFYQQRMAIDQARNAVPPPKMSLNATNVQTGTIKSAEYTRDLINNLFIQPSAKASGTWASVAKGGPQAGKNDDPFSSGQNEEIPKEWSKKSSQESSHKANDERTSASQTSHGPTKSKSGLNANAQSFTSSRTTSPAIKLNPAAVEFTSSTSSPALSVVSAAGRAVGSNTGNMKENEPPRPATSSVLPSSPDITAKYIPTQSHAKKPSLPGNSKVTNQRFVTPAEQVLDLSKVSQPVPPAKEKKVGGGPLPARSGGHPNFMPIKNPRPIPGNNLPAPVEEQPKAATKIEAVPEPARAEHAKQAAKVEAGSELAATPTVKVTADSFPTLDQATATGTTRKRRAASILKDGLPAAVAAPAPAPASTSGKVAVTTKAQKDGASQGQGQRSVTTTTPAVVHQGQVHGHGRGQGQRSVTASTPAVAKAKQPKNEQKQAQAEEQQLQDNWQTVGPNKKNTHTGGGAARGHGGRGGRGGRGDHHGRGGRGARVGNAEERKGG